MQPRPALSRIPPLSMVKVVGDKPPPIRFWPSESCPIVPDSPPEAVRPKEQEDLRSDRADAPRSNDDKTREYMARWSNINYEDRKSVV